MKHERLPCSFGHLSRNLTRLVVRQPDEYGCEGMILFLCPEHFALEKKYQKDHPEFDFVQSLC